MNHYPSETIVTQRLHIRLYTELDLPAMYAMHGVAEVNQYLPYSTWRSWHDALDWHDRVSERRQKGEAEQYVITQHSDVIGSCLAFHFDKTERACEFGYVLAKPYWQNGFMIEAMSAFVPSLFSGLKLERLCASVESDNRASIRLLEKLSFEHCRTSQENEICLRHFCITAAACDAISTRVPQ